MKVQMIRIVLFIYLKFLTPLKFDYGCLNLA